MLAADGVFIPQLFDARDERTLLGVEVALQLGSRDGVEFLQDEGLRFFVG